MILERLSLKGKTALVAGGGGGGIGTATSLALAEAGANVVVIDLLEERVKDTEAKIKVMGGKSLGVVADLRKTSDIELAVAKSIKKFGKVRCLANVAGGMQAGQWGNLETYPEQTFDDVLNLNLRYIFLISKLVAKHMIDKEMTGTIANVASISGVIGAPYHVAYGVAKAGLMSLTKSMAAEWGQYGIRVNGLAPGGVRTPRSIGHSPPNVDEKVRAIVPIGRIAQPEEIAAGMLFLLSPMSSAISGQTIVVNGGATARYAVVGQSEKYALPRHKRKEVPLP